MTHSYFEWPKTPCNFSPLSDIFALVLCTAWDNLVWLRDESFITSWGGRLYSGGVGNFFGDVLGGGLKIKWPMGRGGHVFRQVLGGGVRCVPLVFLFIKSHSFWGAVPPRTPYILSLYTAYTLNWVLRARASSVMWDFLNHWATLEIKYALFLLNNNLFLQMSPSSFSAFNNNHYHQC